MGRRAGCPVHFGARRETRLPRPAAGGAATCARMRRGGAAAWRSFAKHGEVGWERGDGSVAAHLSKSVWQDAKHSRQDAGAPPRRRCETNAGWRDAAALGRIGGAKLENQVG